VSRTRAPARQPASVGLAGWRGMADSLAVLGSAARPNAATLRGLHAALTPGRFNDRSLRLWVLASSRSHVWRCTLVSWLKQHASCSPAICTATAPRPSRRFAWTTARPATNSTCANRILMSSPEQVGGCDRVVEPEQPAQPRKPPTGRRRRLGVAAAVPRTRRQCANGPAPMDIRSAIEVESPVTFGRPSRPAHKTSTSNPESTVLRGVP
jgi:hypothetical protein